MTIDELNALTTLTAADEVPVWDAEASGEPTKKITAQNLAASVKSLADLPNTTEMNAAIAQSTAFHVGDTFNFGGAQILFRTLNDKSAIFFRHNLPQPVGNDVTSFNISVTIQSPTWFSNGNAGSIAIDAVASYKSISSSRAIQFSFPTSATPLANAGFGMAELNAVVTFT